MTWKPSIGMRRAESLIRRLDADAGACGVEISVDPIFRARLLTTIADEIDNALDEGSFGEMPTVLVPPGRDDMGPAQAERIGNGTLAEIDLPDFPAEAPREEMKIAGDAAVQLARELEAEARAVQAAEPKKARGRPPGAKNKKRKAKAKKAKAAAIAETATPEPQAEAPVSEATS